MQTQQALAFDDAFVTGVDEIDNQHRNLIDLTNEAAVVLGGNPAPARVKQLVRELLSYAIYHFRTEEMLMAQYAYEADEPADAVAHVERHREFSAKVVEVQEALQKHEYVDTDALVGYLADWIRRHILGTDQKLAAFILARRAPKA